MGIREVFLAELMIQVWWFKNNRTMFVLSFVWPYATVLILAGLGAAYGSIENLAESLGVSNPLVYLFAGSAVAFASAGIIDNAAGIALWHRWLGTLPYVYISPLRFATYLSVSGITGSVIILLINFGSILPAILVLSGLEGGLRMILVLFVMLAGCFPLIGIAIVAALASLLAREEGNIVSWLNPLLLLVSGVFYPIKILPIFLQEFSKVAPTTYIVLAARIAATFSKPPGLIIVSALYAISLLTILYNGLSAAFMPLAEGAVKRRGAI